jgi:hypothetical protein
MQADAPEPLLTSEELAALHETGQVRQGDASVRLIPQPPPWPPSPQPEAT